MAKLVLVAGMPATGKSTLAKKIAAALGYPILEKDEIKEALFDTVGYRDLAEKRQIDNAATAVLLQTAEKLLAGGVSLIVVNNFGADTAARVRAMIDRCGADAVTVFLSGDAEVLYARYVARDKAHTRHQGHTFIDRYPPQPGDDTERSMTRAFFRERFENDGMAAFDIGGARIDVDATHPETVDAAALIATLRAAFADKKGQKT